MTDQTDDRLSQLIPAPPGLVLLLLDDECRYSHTAPVVLFALVRSLDGQRRCCPYALVNGALRLWLNNEDDPLDDFGDEVYGLYRAHEAAQIIEDQCDSVGDAEHDANMARARAVRDARLQQALWDAAHADEHPQDAEPTGTAKARAIIAAAQSRT